jgi:hypothetical protein
VYESNPKPSYAIVNQLIWREFFYVMATNNPFYGEIGNDYYQCSGSGSTCFGPSGSISQRCESVSGSFYHPYHQAKIVFCDFFWAFFFENDVTVNVTSKSNKQKNLFKKFVFC